MSHFRFSSNAAWSLLICIAAAGITITATTTRVLGQSWMRGSEYGSRPHDTRQLVFDPRGPEQPALRYRLYPERAAMIDRNAAFFYRRAVIHFQYLLLHGRDGGADRLKALQKSLRKWMNSNPEDFPLHEVGPWLEEFEIVFDELERARVSARCDWGFLSLVNESPAQRWSMILSDIQELRTLGRLLSLAIRTDILHSDFEAAARHFQTLFKMAHDLGETRLIFGSLVGVSVAEMGRDELVRWIAQPESPNLYWPLVDLPQPIVDIRPAIRTEWDLLQRHLEPDHATKRMAIDPEAAKQWRVDSEAYLEKVSKVAALFLAHRTNRFQDSREGKDDRRFRWDAFMGPSSDSSAKPMLRFAILRNYPVAKAALIHDGFDPEWVESLSVVEAVSLQEYRVTTRLRDEFMKTLNLPTPEMLTALAEAENEQELQQFVVGGPTANSHLLPVFELALPPIREVIRASFRANRHLKAIEVIEAIRAHVVETGRLPEKLSDIQDLTVPDNPEIGEPFSYQTTREFAELLDKGSLPTGDVLFQLQIRSKNEKEE